MLFNSLDFLIFMVVFFAIWPLLRRRNNTRWLYLVTASFVFYGWWDWRFLFLIVGSGLIDFLCGLGMARFPRHKKALLIVSIVGNVGSLATFKYLDFGLANINGLLGLFGFHAELPAVGLILPIGISFYTFQSMSYTIEVYQGHLKPTRNILHFFAYLAMFPQLVAGPIIRAKDMLPQLKTYRPTNEKQRWDSLQLIGWGFFKKVVIADSLAPIINNAFDSSSLFAASGYWWIIMIMFAFQIYCDFSGYSDIARGLGKWMGYEFPLNFNHPYGALSLRDFWGRWHISLSTWFRDYVYIPLGGSRCSAGRAYGNMWMAMLISGLWHGAAWTFVLWGAWHALLLSLERLTNWPKRLAQFPWGRHLSAILVFLLVVIGWVFFRAETFGQALAILRAMFSFTTEPGNWIAVRLGAKSLGCVSIMILCELYFHLGWSRIGWERYRLVRAAQPVMLAVLLTACVFMRGPGSAFIYFQF